MSTHESAAKGGSLSEVSELIPERSKGQNISKDLTQNGPASSRNAALSLLSDILAQNVPGVLAHVISDGSHPLAVLAKDMTLPAVVLVIPDSRLDENNAITSSSGNSGN